MSANRPPLHLVAGAALFAVLLTTGCSRPYYYQPQYQQPYPIQTLQPGSQYAPGGTIYAPGQTLQGPALQGPTLGQPGSLEPIPADNPPSTYQNGTGQPSSGGDEPYFTPQRQDNAVPNYDDPSYDNGFNGFGDPNRDFNNDFPQPSEPPDSDLQEAFNPSALTPAPRDVELAAVPSGSTSPFEPNPVPSPTTMPDAALQPAGFESTQPGTTIQPTEPYAFDADGYTWLRGIVGYDHTEQTWSVTYDVTPDTWDSYAGHLTLVGEVPPDVKDGDVVLIEGAIDAAQTDRFGKPVYRVATCAALEPAAP